MLVGSAGSIPGNGWKQVRRDIPWKISPLETEPKQTRSLCSSWFLRQMLVGKRLRCQHTRGWCLRLSAFLGMGLPVQIHRVSPPPLPSFLWRRIVRYQCQFQCWGVRVCWLGSITWVDRPWRAIVKVIAKWIASNNNCLDGVLQTEIAETKVVSLTIVSITSKDLS